MNSQLQKTGYNQSQYERPDQPWICGWTAEGHPCRVGPDRRGRCTAAAQRECRPRRERDRYVCTRLEVFGGPCQPGPRPDGSCCGPLPEQPICQPRLSIRAKRRRVVLAVLLLAVGALVFLIGGPWRLRFVSPGPLNSAHAAIKPQDDATHCAACHGSAEGGLGKWVIAAVGDSNEPGQSAKCLTCHFKDDGVSAERAMWVHGVEPKVLAEKTGHVTNRPRGPGSAALALASLAGGPPVSDRGLLGCSTCHREHRGISHDITFMDDNRCQVCHQVQFAAFGEGHPNFGPVLHSGGIAFDHLGHKQTYFGQAVFDCARCHAADSTGITMGTRPFAQSCAGCHGQGTNDHHTAAIKKLDTVILQLPEMELDEDTYWPEEAAIGEELTPMVRLLLVGDDQVLGAVRSLDEDEDADGIPYDWEPVDEQLKLALVSGIKRLIHDLMVEEDKAFVTPRRRLATALAMGQDDSRIVDLADQLSTARLAIQAYQDRWLPSLAEDLSGQAVGLGATGSPDRRIWAGGSPGWLVDPDEALVGFAPTAHADALLKRLVDAVVASIDSAPDDARPNPDAEYRGQVRSQLFEQWASKRAGGILYSACLRCHRVDRDHSGRRRVSWFAAGRPLGATGWAKFNHRPHLTVLGGRSSCVHCHEFSQDSSSQTGLSGRHGGFSPHTPSHCATCHAPGRAPDNCLTCHNYHFYRP